MKKIYFFVISFVFFLPVSSHGQHSLDRLFSAESRSKPREEGRIEASVIDSGNAADSDLRERIDATNRVLRAARDSSEASSKTSGSDANDAAKGGKSAKNTSDVRTWQCKVYCKSGGGPIVWKEVSAKSRREAATFVGENADGICNASGHKYASSIAYPEYYCSVK
jgi:hypothetical protein